MAQSLHANVTDAKVFSVSNASTNTVFTKLESCVHYHRLFLHIILFLGIALHVVLITLTLSNGYIALTIARLIIIAWLHSLL